MGTTYKIWRNWFLGFFFMCEGHVWKEKREHQPGYVGYSFGIVKTFRLIPLLGCLVVDQSMLT
jgi:hypothetical protein